MDNLFKVTFACKEQTDGVAYLQYHSVGFNVVEKLGADLSVLEGLSVDSLGASYIQTYIPTDCAKASGHFSTKGLIAVIVPPNSLNQFIEYKLLRNGARIGAEINHSAVVKAWARAGYPLEWNPDAKPALTTAERRLLRICNNAYLSTEVAHEAFEILKDRLKEIL